MRGQNAIHAFETFLETTAYKEKCRFLSYSQGPVHQSGSKMWYHVYEDKRLLLKLLLCCLCFGENTPGKHLRHTRAEFMEKFQIRCDRRKSFIKCSDKIKLRRSHINDKAKDSNVSTTTNNIILETNTVYRPFKQNVIAYVRVFNVITGFGMTVFGLSTGSRKKGTV